MSRLIVVLLAGVLALGFAVGCSGETETPEPQVKPLSTRLAEADQAFRNNQYDEAGRMFEETAGLAAGEGDTSAYVEAAAMRARSYLIQGNATEGREWLARAAKDASPADPRGWSRYLGVRGRFEWEDGENEKATETFLEMYDYCNEHELYDRAVDAAHMIALTGDPEEKTEWAMRGIEMAEKANMIGWLGPLWNNLGWDYVDAERYDEALDALRKARDYHYMGTAEIPKLIADYSVAYVLRLKGDLAEAEVGMRDVFKRAEELKAAGNPDALEWMGFSRWELGEIAISKDEKGLGLGMLKKALGELEEAGMPTWDADDWEKRNARIEELER
jgi:tetratricopeptide (TPR) repeat protein